MASPQSSASPDDTSAPRKLEQITFRFCSECSNMLYPKEDEDAHKLQFTCRTCQYTEEASSTCVFRNVLNNSAGETAGVTQDVASDPTRDDKGWSMGLPHWILGLIDDADLLADYEQEPRSDDADPGDASMALSTAATDPTTNVHGATGELHELRCPSSNDSPHDLATLSDDFLDGEMRLHQPRSGGHVALVQF